MPSPKNPETGEPMTITEFDDAAQHIADQFGHEEQIGTDATAELSEEDIADQRALEAAKHIIDADPEMDGAASISLASLERASRAAKHIRNMPASREEAAELLKEPPVVEQGVLDINLPAPKPPTIAQARQNARAYTAGHRRRTQTQRRGR